MKTLSVKFHELIPTMDALKQQGAWVWAMDVTKNGYDLEYYEEETIERQEELI